jgi:hypothetical protein
VLSITNTSPATQPAPILLGIGDAEADQPFLAYLRGSGRPGDLIFLCEPRGLGATRWTEKNPPNYVKRSHALLGRTVDTGRVWDVIATARSLSDFYGGKLVVVGEGSSAVLAAYAALWEPDISEVILRQPPLTHTDATAPQFLNVLRVCDVPDVLGMLAPRPLTVVTPNAAALEKTAAIYRAAGATDKFVVQAN